MKRRFSSDDESVLSNGINNLVDTFIADPNTLWLKDVGGLSVVFLGNHRVLVGFCYASQPPFKTFSQTSV